MKIDLSKNVGNNIFYVNRYNIQIKRDEKINWYFVVPAFTILGILSYASFKVSITFWTFLICALLAGILASYWTYKYLNKGIASILKSLDEIRELKEE